MLLLPMKHTSFVPPPAHPVAKHPMSAYIPQVPFAPVVRPPGAPLGTCLCPEHRQYEICRCNLPSIAPWNCGQSRNGRTRVCPRCSPCHGAVLLHRSIAALRKECSATAHTPAARQGLLSCIGIPAGWCVANTTPACPALLTRLHPEYPLKYCTVVLSFQHLQINSLEYNTLYKNDYSRKRCK